MKDRRTTRPLIPPTDLKPWLYRPDSLSGVGRGVLLQGYRSWRPLRLVLGLALGVSLFFSAATLAAVPRPSVLLISIDTLRPDHLGSYGYPRATDSVLLRRTAHFLRYVNAYTSIPLTLPAHTSMMTGQLPLALGLFNNHQHLPVPGLRRPLLAEILLKAGYRTAAVVSSPVLASSTGFDAGFQQYLEPDSDARPPVLTAEQVNERAAGLLEGGAKPFFLFVHYYDVHEPFSFPDRYGCWLRPDRALDEFLAQHRLRGVRYRDVLNRDRSQPVEENGQVLTLERMIARYDASIRYATDNVADLLALWDSSIYGPGSLVIITSDHGEGLGQHQFWSHGMNLYDEAIRIPLLIRGPGFPPEGGEVDSDVMLPDLAPTILQASGISLSADMENLSLRVAPGRRYASRREILVQRMRYFAPGRAAGLRNWRAGNGFAILLGRYKYIQEAGLEPVLFDRQRDGLELHGMTRGHGGIQAKLKKKLLAWETVTDTNVPWPPVPVDNEHARRLRSLGYVGGGDVHPD